MEYMRTFSPDCVSAPPSISSSRSMGWGRTERTIITWNLAFGTSTLKSKSTNPTNIIFLIIIIVLIILPVPITIGRRFRSVVVEFMLIRWIWVCIPFPYCYRMIGWYWEFHLDEFERLDIFDGWCQRSILVVMYMNCIVVVTTCIVVVDCLCLL